MAAADSSPADSALPPLAVLDAPLIRRIAVEAARDPRVVRGVLLGRPSTATSRAAVADALHRLGLAIVVPSHVRPEPPHAT